MMYNERKKIFDAIILAAGIGKRLGFEGPKCLLNIGERSLLENHIEGIRNLLKEDLNRIYILINKKYKKSYFNCLREIESKNSNISIIFIDSKTKNYGGTLKEALNYSKSKYILYVMGDHYIDYSHLNRLIKKERLLSLFKERSFILTMDTSKNCPTLQSQLKINKNLIAKKNLTNFDFVEMGIILTKRSFILNQIKKMRSKEFQTQDILLVSKKEQIGFIKTYGIFWFGINTREDLKKGLKLYFKKKLTYRDVYITSQKGIAGVLAKLIYKRISSVITYITLKLYPKTTPNSATLFRILFFIASTIYFIFHKNLFLYSICLLINEWLDAVDGTIAKIKYECSKFGDTLDKLTDKFIHFFSFVLIGLITKNVYFSLFAFVKLFHDLIFRNRNCYGNPKTTKNLTMLIISKFIESNRFKRFNKRIDYKKVDFGFPADIMYTLLIISVIINKVEILPILLIILYLTAFVTKLILKVI